MLIFENYVSKFKKEIKNKNFDSIEEFDIYNNKMFETALRLGYKDAQRTFTNINKLVWEKHNDSKDKFFDSFSEEIQKIFIKKESNFSPKFLFDKFTEFFQSYGYTVTYGQAQKVINMTFKYLYCLDDKKQYKEDIFDKCHMPLDSFTLAWYKRNILKKTDAKDYQIKSEDSWSKLEKEKYTHIQELIKNRVEKGLKIKINGINIPLPEAPLDAEFVIWQEEIMNQAVTNFNKTVYKSLNKKYSKKDDYREMLKDTEEYINQLRREL